MTEYQKIYKRLGDEFETCGDHVSGLDLSEIGEDGHQVANLMWKISALMKRRANA